MRRTRRRRSCTKRPGRMKSGLSARLTTLAEAAERENIKKTALIIVGDVTAQAGYERSRLYAPEFTTEFRQGTDGFVYE